MAAINTIIEDLTAALAADATLTNWGVATYGQDVTILENCDPRNEPESDDCPLIIVFPGSKIAGVGQPNKSHVIEVSCGVYDSTKPVSAAGVVRFTGGRNVEIMRGYALDVIKDNIPANTEIHAIISDYNTIDNFPYVSINMQIVITEPHAIGAGSNPFE